MVIVGFVTQIYIEANLFKYLKVATKIIENIFHSLKTISNCTEKMLLLFTSGLEAMEFLSIVLAIGNIHNVIK